MIGKTVKRIARALELPTAIPHELSHYLTARLLSVGATFGLRATASDVDAPRWKRILISIAPTFTGLVVLIPSILYYRHLRLQGNQYTAPGLIAVLGMWYGAGALGACAGDWRDVVYILIGKPLPKYESQSQLDNW